MNNSCEVPSKKLIENIFQSHLKRKIRISKDILPFLHLQFILFLKELASRSDMEAFKHRRLVLSKDEISVCAPSLLKKYRDASTRDQPTAPAPESEGDQEATDST
ncbi:uncharacterized protein LOC122264292 [Penaeus japonicus]|uniref:uncharacterized protein LOC122264292 n=1 Tax=Penaeus japonicus TaxID=27405 RepID=UPI001C71221B|nr:uncharacterized protein LOC122264292 [Penaeus japonicus]